MTMLKSFAQLSLLAALGAVTGCGATARTPDQYRADTSALLETQSVAIKECYDQILRSDPNVSGKVAIRFTVKEDTGQITDAVIDSASTTAPEPLAQCVLQAVANLKLMPPDAHDGRATFVYEFQINPAPPPPAPTG
jgi:hypothetical protein